MAILDGIEFLVDDALADVPDGMPQVRMLNRRVWAVSPRVHAALKLIELFNSKLLPLLVALGKWFPEMASSAEEFTGMADDLRDVLDKAKGSSK